MLTIGYIGNGKSTNRYQMPYVLCRKDKFRVKTVYNPRIHHDKWAKVEGVNYTESLDELLNDPEIDLISVCTSHELHYDYVKQVLEHGKHCLCEKPFMPSSALAREMFELAKSKNLFVGVYQCKRYDSDFLTTQQVINSGVLGDIFEVNLHYDYYRPYMSKLMPGYYPLYSIVYGHACHTLDQALSFFGKPKSFTSDARQLLGPGRSNDYYDIDLFYDGLKVTCSANYFCAKPRASFTVYGTKGMFVKQTKDRQEEHLKVFYMPWQPGFGLDTPEQYGVLTYYDEVTGRPPRYDESGQFHEEKVPTLPGDYGRTYDDIYEHIVNHRPKVITDEQILTQLEIMEATVKDLR